MPKPFDQEAPIVGLSCRVYQVLLDAYPPAFLREFSEEMRLIFRDGCRAAYRTAGQRGVREYAWRMLGDLMVSAGQERIAAIDRRAAAQLLLAFGIGLGIGYLDFHASEVQGIVLLLLVATGLFGLASPRRAWRWALVIAGGIPLLHLLNALLRRPPPYPVEPNVFASLIALIPGLIGAYAGSLFRSFVAPLPGGDGKV